MNSNLRRAMPWLAALVVLGATWLAYRPGLSGGFLFDDFVNLDAIGATGPVQDWPTFWRYITSGTADPTGRPLALLSFLLDARDWPADPSPFLHTNLWLHLINGALLFSLLRRLGIVLGDSPPKNDAIALLGTGLWLLHPLLVSTTLYVVQREAMLPATFTLLGLCIYAAGRQRFNASAGSAGIRQMSIGIIFGTAMAMLCKGNGILLPLLAWVLEYTVWGGVGNVGLDICARVRLRRIRLFLLIVPSLAIIAYLIINTPGLHDQLAGRTWTIAQRLFTEPRVLLDYLWLLAVPRSISTGLYNDAYPLSFSLWNPITTAPAILLVGLLVIASIRYRSQAPRLSAAILFFFAGHILESATIPLEIYFEHRNYLPALLLFWPLANTLCSWRASPVLRSTVALLLLALLFGTTRARAELWGHPEQLAATWSLQNPESSRAQATAGMALINAGRFREATEHLAVLWRQRPDDLQLALNYVDAACQWRGISEQDKQALGSTLARTSDGQLLIHQWLGRAIDVAQSGRCQGMALDDVSLWIAASAKNPQINRPASLDQTIEPLLARLAIARRQPDVALVHFNKALLAFTTPDVAARNASLLASSGYYDQALAHLDIYEQNKAKVPRPAMGMPWLHDKVLELENYWPHEMTILRGKLATEISARSFGTKQNQATEK